MMLALMERQLPLASLPQIESCNQCYRYYKNGGKCIGSLNKICKRLYLDNYWKFLRGDLKIPKVYKLNRKK